MKPTALILLAIIFLWSQLVLAADCTSLTGEFKVWNGWPPALRLIDPKTGVTYGIAKSTPLPRKMEKALKTKHFAEGTFCIKVIKQTAVPYQKAPIDLVRIISYEP